MITIVNELELLNVETRKQIIKQIQSDQNAARKQKKLKAYEIYKDLTKKWVIESISKEFSQKTVEQMVNRASNISVVRKIVDKKAKCYSGGVKREIKDDAANTEKLNALAKYLQFDSLMKKADRFSELLKNVMVQVIYQNDCVETDGAGTPKKRLVNRILLPHQFDPICDAHDPCQPIGYVLSDFYDTKTLIVNNLLSDQTGYRDPSQPAAARAEGAAPSEHERPSVYIWWSGKLHFTTDDKGNILTSMSPEGMVNPIGQMNAVSVHGDQDDSYWCDGGDDLIDGGVLINVLLTDLFSIMNIQGWGQMVVMGKKIPTEITGGPHRALTFEFDTGDPTPKVEFVSSNPPLSDWREAIAMYVALLLSTNGLSTSNVSTKLEGSSGQVASGVAMMLDSAESMEPVEDKQKMFQGAEKKAWKLNFATQNYLFDQGVAVSELQEIGRVESDGFVTTTFHQTKAVMTETEKAEILQKKKDSGLYKISELLMIKNPDLTQEEADKQAEEILADRIKYAMLYQAAVTGLVSSMNKNPAQEDPNAAPIEQNLNANANEGGKKIP